MTWTYSPGAIVEALERAGFDVNRSTEDLIGGGSLTARRERADRTTLVVIDAGGRFRIDLTARLSEREAPVTLGGLALRSVESTVWTRTVTGQLTDPSDFERVLAALTSGSGLEDDVGADARPSTTRADGPW